MKLLTEMSDDELLEQRNLYDDEIKKLSFEKQIDYNIKDVEIVTRLDNKLKLFDLILSIAYKAGINYSDVVSPVITWDVLIYNTVMDQGIVPSMETPNNKAGQYIGAFVKEPKPGMYNWVMSTDLNSLYPHLQMGINISPEKRVPESELSEDLINLRDQIYGGAEHGVMLMLEEELDTSILQKHDVSLSPNGQFYRRDSDGFIPVILEGLYSERKAVKRSMLDDKQKMENDPSLCLDDQIDAKNTLQMALKILMNSEYGALANKYFRYFDLRNAEAITSSGQLAIMWVAKHLNIFLNHIVKTKDKDYIIAIDTDSVVYDSEIYVNGNKIKIGDYYKSVCSTPDSNGVKIVNNDDTSLSLNKSFDVEEKKINYIMKHVVKKRMYKVSSGCKSVIITEDHSLMVERESKLVKIKVKDIKEDDSVIRLL